MSRASLILILASIIASINILLSSKNAVPLMKKVSSAEVPRSVVEMKTSTSSSSEDNEEGSSDFDENTVGNTNSTKMNDLLAAKFSQYNCTDEEFTVRCVCGADTHPDYIKNMVETYAQSRYDSSLFEKCLNMPLPFDANTTLQCWPKMFMLVSFPTSGNELARSILQKAVKRNVFLAHYKEPGAHTPNSHLFTVKAAGNKLKVRTNNCGRDHKDDYQRSMPLPMMGKPGIYKSHVPRGWKAGLSPQLTNNPKLGGQSTSGIIHLSRNPGDQLLRDRFRWPNKNGCSSTHECFLQNGHKYCDKAVDYGLEWSNWHNFWFDKSLNTPHILYHYENFSSTNRMPRVTEEVLDFLNELPPQGDVEYSLKDELAGIVKDPPYEHGTLMAQVCGKDKARVLHENTKEVTKKLGYEFDYDSATWSLSA